MLRPAGSLRSLLANLIDYAGLYPPASLPLAIVSERYQCFLSSPESWILNRLVLPAGQLSAAPIQENWRITLLVDAEPGPLPPQVETLETKDCRPLRLPTYCERTIDRINRTFAKIRTGGLTPDAIPSTAMLTTFLCEATTRRLPFKATAGLHHPLRAQHRLTYAADSPSAVMHGFLNVFIAAAFAWHGMEPAAVQDILEESRPDAFEFLTDELRWNGRSLTTAQIESARRDFAHSFGSCSFEEPISALRELGLLK
jgi:hypothetical protein